MTIKTINKLVGYGILTFLIGFFAGLHWIKLLQLLIPIGTFMTFTGIVFFFKDTNLTEHFQKAADEDIMTYFWNVIVLKLWTFIFAVWMIMMNLALITKGFQ